MEHVGIVVDDLAAATAFFVDVGLELQGEGQVEGGWVDRVVALEGVRAELAMMETPDGSIGSATSADRKGSSSSWRSGSAEVSG
jgi:catechol 2,3-dioxygenase-like lactoylglutathione lyase family enzyme